MSPLRDKERGALFEGKRIAGSFLSPDFLHLSFEFQHGPVSAGGFQGKAQAGALTLHRQEDPVMRPSEAIFEIVSLDLAQAYSQFVPRGTNLKLREFLGKLCAPPEDAVVNFQVFGKLRHHLLAVLRPPTAETNVLINVPACLPIAPDLEGFDFPPAGQEHFPHTALQFGVAGKEQGRALNGTEFGVTVST